MTAFCGCLIRVDFRQKPTISFLAATWTEGSNRWRLSVYSLHTRSNIPITSSCYAVSMNVTKSTGSMAFTTNVCVLIRVRCYLDFHLQWLGKRRYSITLWKKFNDCFNCLPIAAIIGEKIFAVHGGLSPDLQSMEQIRKISRPTDVPDTGENDFYVRLTINEHLSATTMIRSALWLDMVWPWRGNYWMGGECQRVDFHIWTRCRIALSSKVRHGPDLPVTSGEESLAMLALDHLFMARSLRTDMNSSRRGI